ncbi:DUF1513 domain-containing protein [Psychrobacter sp. I-STPA6b]|uniref:DUF1513 domain-containing protein n=1 Tax=Psychrobacter sp. I-STPA6b TaxID=2585718 RepID=UPI001D0CC157|nr:DUF1513 domain-containing protein [Psychrobacter sp. I-STPA6b]
MSSRTDTSPAESTMTVALKTLAMSVVGTAGLVAVHHYYRKRHQPEARIQDYATGVYTQLKRLRYANSQAVQAWQQAWILQTPSMQSHYPDTPCTETPLSAINPNVQTLEGTHPLTKENIASVTHPQSSAVPNCRHGIKNTELEVAWVSGVADLTQGEFAVVGIADTQKKEIVWQTSMPERVHDIVVQPVPCNQSESIKMTSSISAQQVVVMGRRPSEHFWVLDAHTGAVVHAITASEHRHFYGHACFSLDGQYLYVTENDTVSLSGLIGVYSVAHQYQKVAEFASYGIGPHELLAHPDGDTLVIANGGIKTEKASREELNLDSMQPSLVYLSRHDGTLLEQVFPEHNQMSVRHLSIHPDGTVAIGIQFQGERHLNYPLVLTHRRGDSEFSALNMPNGQWQRFHHYIASVAIDAKHNLLCASSPIGGCAVVYDLNTRQFIDAIALPDCAGVAVLSATDKKDTSISTNIGGFIVTDGQGNLTQLTLQKTSQNDDEQCTWHMQNAQARHSLAFDNHLQRL